jgi:probable HAF family extracellular repeat protein
MPCLIDGSRLSPGYRLQKPGGGVNLAGVAITSSAREGDAMKTPAVAAITILLYAQTHGVADIAMAEPAHAIAARTSIESFATPRYTYTDLGVLGVAGGTESSAAWNINSTGQVVGASTTNLFGATHAFLWQDGQLVDLGTLSHNSFAASAAYGVNDAGTIVGQTNVDPGSEPPHAFRYRNGVMSDLGTGFGTGSFSRAWDINAVGQIVGERARTQSSPVRAFLARNGRFLDLGTLGGRSHVPFSIESVAYAVNDLGQVVGTALPPDPPLHAFLWRDGVMLDLGTLGGDGEATEAYGINDRGQVVGASPTAGGRVHGFVWRDAQMQDLGTLGGSTSYAYGINRSGQVVGVSRTPTSPASNAGHAFLWMRGAMADLNDAVSNLPADVVLEVARAISDDGCIVGTTCTEFCEPGATAPTHAYLLTPEQ